jgi:hypothetical protein
MPPAASPIDIAPEEDKMDDDDDETKPAACSSTSCTAAAAAASGYASLKVAELKRLLQQRGVSFTDCVEKVDLVKRLLESCGASESSSSSVYSTMKLEELKQRLQQRGISFADCIEKSNLVERLESSEDRSIPAVNGTNSPPGRENGGGGGGGVHPFFSAGYTTKRAAASAAGAVGAAASEATDRNPNHQHRDTLGPLADGESKAVAGSKAGKVWTIKRAGRVYSCTCPTWKFQPNVKSSEQRRCKHIDSLRAGYAPILVDDSNSNNKKKRAVASDTTTTKSHKNAKTGSDDDDDTSDTEEFLKVTLAEKWDANKQDPTGYYLSEKLDGMRCILKDGKLWRYVVYAFHGGGSTNGDFCRGSSHFHNPCSRNGKPIYAPEFFMDALPPTICLDGELFAGRKHFQSLMSIKSNPDDPRWSNVCYLVYDAPLVKGPFTVRLQALCHALASVPSRIAKALEQVRYEHFFIIKCRLYSSF